MNKRTIKRAVGVSNGKTLVLANDCARVGVQRERHADGSWHYHVDGDTSDGEKVFSDPEKALAYALKGLAEYMDGSPNR